MNHHSANGESLVKETKGKSNNPNKRKKGSDGGKGNEGVSGNGGGSTAARDKNRRKQIAAAHVSAIANALVDYLQDKQSSPGVADGQDAEKDMMALLEKEEDSILWMNGTGATAALTIATLSVSFLTDPNLATNKSKVDTAPNKGAGSPVSLAAILCKTGLHKLDHV